MGKRLKNKQLSADSSEDNSNRKVRNATVIEYDGHMFKSKLEYRTYKAFQEANIPVGYERKTFTLIDSFTYNNEKIRRITITPDFDGDGFILETKGFATDIFKLRWKLFKNYLCTNGLYYDLYMPRTMKDVHACIKVIKSKIDGAKQ